MRRKRRRCDAEMRPKANNITTTQVKAEAVVAAAAR